MNYKIGDILYFKNYIFTDTHQSARHFALVLLPPTVMEFTHNLLCSVITSRETRYFSLRLSKNKYKCFEKDSYACFNRRDINSIYDLDEGIEQPSGCLDAIDIKKGFKILKAILYGTTDTYLVATIIREWKKVRDNLL